MKWYDYSSPDYIKYLGYPVYVTVQQRDSFIANITAKIKAQVDFFMIRRISMYGRAKVANTMILSKLWHILRLTPIPKAAMTKINSIIYQYIVDERKLQIKKDVYYLPREEGGLGLFHVGAQQQSLQMRYIRALLTHNQQQIIPAFLYKLMVQTLQFETNNASTESIMLFPDTRYKSKLKEGALTLESDVHLILSLNSILLLQNNNRLHKAMLPFFGNKLYTRIREHNLDSWDSTSKFPGDVLLKIIEIAQSVYEKTTDRIGASISILNLASTMDDKINRRLIVSASQLLQSLPMDPTNTDISETTLITRYIVPLLQPLFDKDDLNIRLDFTATELAEKCKRPPNFNGCPDCIITRFPHQTDDGINIGYGKVKKISMASNHYLVNWDLVRLAFFSKKAIDDNHLGGNISIHIVGSTFHRFLFDKAAV
ncbi:hypothetical protein HMPREF1544_06414 [Mucor circinelloides 1006PhL]|uniref:Uncharacterized protein n=1 Tax=Mucor circinelloides f. circinelloides (strain 1006PhL) TaxID=1220926 RepID=S2JVH6_MUCC1|nr:hypothetical protein HMPREF1544_06414 [Mucor circinelloides 1006PhL]